MSFLYVQVTLKEHDLASGKADFDIVFRLFPVIEVYTQFTPLYCICYYVLCRKRVELNLCLMQGSTILTPKHG